MPSLMRDDMKVLVNLDEEEEEEKDQVVDCNMALKTMSTATSNFIEPNQYLYTQCEVQAFDQTILQDILTSVTKKLTK